MTKPHIGITTSFEDGVQSVNHAYIEAISKSGGLPIIVPMLQDESAMQAFSEILDGLLITGGPGITKGLIGELPKDLPPVSPIRDVSDTLIFNAMQDRPVLGICYGMQFINAQAGGSIYGDVMAQRQDTLIHSSSRGGKAHVVKFASDSHLCNILQRNSLVVNTYHIQAVAEVGANLRVVGQGTDGVIEAIESLDGRMIGVQFHPERMLDETKSLFEDFVQRCKRHH